MRSLGIFGFWGASRRRSDRRARIVSAVLVCAFLSLSLTGCAGHQLSRLQGFYNSFKEHTELMEDGEYRPFNVPRLTMEKLMEFVEEENIDKLYEPFSPAVKEEADDLYEKVGEFIRFCKNTVTSWNYTGGGGSGDRLHGVVLVTQSIFTDFFADSGEYQYYFSDVSRSSEHPERVGITRFIVCPVEVTTEYAPKKVPGIYIVYRAEDMPEEASIGQSPMETLIGFTEEEDPEVIRGLFSPTARRSAEELEEKTAELMEFLGERVTAWEPFTWTQNRETIDGARVTTREMFFYLHTGEGLYRCDIREVLDRDDGKEDAGFSSVSIFPAKYAGVEPEFEDDGYEEQCTWGRDNMGVSIVYW